MTRRKENRIQHHSQIHSPQIPLEGQLDHVVQSGSSSSSSSTSSTLPKHKAIKTKSPKSLPLERATEPPLDDTPAVTPTTCFSISQASSRPPLFLGATTRSEGVISLMVNSVESCSASTTLDISPSSEGRRRRRRKFSENSLAADHLDFEFSSSGISADERRTDVGRNKPRRNAAGNLGSRSLEEQQQQQQHQETQEPPSLIMTSLDGSTSSSSSSDDRVSTIFPEQKPLAVETIEMNTPPAQQMFEVDLVLETAAAAFNNNVNYSTKVDDDSFQRTSTSQPARNDNDNDINNSLHCSEAADVSYFSTTTDTNNKNDDAMSAALAVTCFYNIPYVHGSFAASAPMMLQDRKWKRILRRIMPAAHADAVEMLRQARSKSTRRTTLASRVAKIMKWAENNPVVAAYGVVQSRSVVPQNSRPEKSSRRPTTLLTGLTVPEMYRMNHHHQQLRHHLLGVAESTSSSPKQPRPPTLEWDVFLDPALVREVEDALRYAEEVKALETRGVEDYQAAVAAEVEVDRQVARLINRMVLAHGTTAQLAAEAFGVSPNYNFSNIVEQSESQRLYRRKKQQKFWEGSGIQHCRNGHDLGGKALHRRPSAFVDDDAYVTVPGKSGGHTTGLFVQRWLRLFAASLELDQDDEDELMLVSPTGSRCREIAVGDIGEDVAQQKQSYCGMFLCLGYGDPNSQKTTHKSNDMVESLKKIEAYLGSPLHVVLDLKSRRVPPRVWARLIDSLRSRGLVVDGIGSFDICELRKIGALCTAPVEQIRFFHSAGDLQKACHADEVEIGDTVFFNAGSLIQHESRVFSGAICGCGQGALDNAVSDDEIPSSTHFGAFAYPSKEVKDRVGDIVCTSTLEDYKRRFDLNIGVYVQEFAVSEEVVDSLVRFVNKYEDVYNLGMAWGGINGRAVQGLVGDGYWNQRYVGRAWDTTAEPSGQMELLQPVDHRLVQQAARAGTWGHLATVNLAGEQEPDVDVGACASHLPNFP